MRASVLLSNVLLFVCLPAAGLTPAADTLVVLPEFEVSQTRDGYDNSISRLAQQADILSPQELTSAHVVTPKDASNLVPNVSMPDYGSAMTSTVYIRGLGSRIDESVMGMVVDGVPLLDKNMFDFRLQDVRRIEILRGPQGTLYGRNTMGGIMDIRTILPMDISGRQNITANAEYATANSAYADAAIRRRETDKFGWGLSGQYNRTDGFYRNQYNGSLIDHSQGASGRFVLDFKPKDEWRVTNTISAGWTDQGAYPYASAETRIINYNDTGSYHRICAVEALHATREWERHTMELSASYQYLNDLMRMDNDYTPKSIFTLEQGQRVHSATLDGLVRSKGQTWWYDFLTGAAAFIKHGDMHAPVTFKRDGIEELILSNANRGIRKAFPDDSLEIVEQQFIVESDFKRLNAGAALYHQSIFKPVKGLTLKAGIRLDVEYVSLDYDCSASLHYRMTALMKQPKPFTTSMKGVMSDTYFQVLPRVSVQYDFSKLSLYAYAAKGSKAGGYNTQIFSTIIQNRMMADMMADMGVHMDGMGDERYTKAEITKYRPEKAWTYEAGLHWSAAEGLRIDADIFYIDIQDQQVTVFPEGKTAGRMMTNAARSRSLGAEATLLYRWQKNSWRGMIHGSYGFTDARFISFDDGINNYSGNHIPYSPMHTAYLGTDVCYRAGKRWLDSVSLSLSGEGRGRIWWNEANTLSQPFYALLNASVEIKWKYVSLQLWARNLTGTQYDVFYFVSMSNAFLQQGKPRQLGIRIAAVF